MSDLKEKIKKFKANSPSLKLSTSKKSRITKLKSPSSNKVSWIADKVLKLKQKKSLVLSNKTNGYLKNSVVFRFNSKITQKSNPSSFKPKHLKTSSWLNSLQNSKKVDLISPQSGIIARNDLRNWI